MAHRGLGSQHMAGKIAHIHHQITSQQARPGDHVLEFPDVAGPTIALQDAQCLRSEVVHLFARFLAHQFQEMAGQDGDVGHATAQGWQFDVNHVDSVVKIFAKATLGHSLGEILVRRQDGAGVDALRLGASNRFEFQVLQDAEHFDLHARRSRGNLVQEQRAVIRLLKLTDFIRRRPGERPSHMAKQLAFQQRIRAGPRKRPPRKAGRDDRSSGESLGQSATFPCRFRP